MSRPASSGHAAVPVFPAPGPGFAAGPQLGPLQARHGGPPPSPASQLTGRSLWLMQIGFRSSENYIEDITRNSFTKEGGLVIIVSDTNCCPFGAAGSRLAARWSCHALHTWQTGVYRHRAPFLLPHATPSPCSCPRPLQPPVSAQPPLQPHTQGRRRKPRTHAHLHTHTHTQYLSLLLFVKCGICLSISNSQTVNLPSVVYDRSVA